MSTQEARKVVSRAVTDEEFRGLLFSNPDQALAGYSLTASEASALRGLPAEAIDNFAGQLEARISMSVLVFAAEAYGGDAVGGQLMGAESYGGEATGGDPMAGEAAGGEAYGSVAAGGDAAGGEAFGSDPSSGEIPESSWLARLAEALGLRKFPVLRDEVNYY